MKQWDLFICHASEDKCQVVDPLVEILTKAGLRVWYDRFILEPGDSLRESIDEGLSQSRFGVVVISFAFFKKSWARWELNGLVQRQITEGRVILPVWHEVSVDDVRKYSPSLANIVAPNTAAGIKIVAERLIEVIKRSPLKGKTAGPRLPYDYTIVLDIGHNLHKWDRGALPRLHVDFEGLYKIVLQRKCRVIERDLADFSLKVLRGINQIVIVCPKDCHYNRAEIDHLVQFCRSGGTLLVLAYYWWKSDHDSNIGDLTAYFGIHLRDDRVFDPACYDQNEYRPVCSCLFPKLSSKPVVVPFCCTMQLDGQAQPILLSSKNARSEVVQLVDRGIVRKYETVSNGPLVVASSAKLSRGKIVVIGSWEIFLDQVITEVEFGNAEFLGGLMSWLRAE